MTVESYLRRGQRGLERMMLDPRIRWTAAAAAYGGGGFLLSGISLAGGPQPVAMGLICALSGWRTLAAGLGAMLGYPAFWGQGGRQGLAWAASACTLALLAGRREETREQPLMLPVLTAFLYGVTGLVFALVLKERTALYRYPLGMLLTFGAGVLFTQVRRQRDGVTQWILGGVTALALADIGPHPWLKLGFVAAGIIGIRGAFPGAVLAGLGLDLARVTPVPMTAVLSAAGLVRMVPFDKKWQHYASGTFACLGVMAAVGLWDPAPPLGLLLGGGIGALLPLQPGMIRSRGPTGAAQVRLELGAEVLAQTRRILQEEKPREPDQEAVLLSAVDRACSGCSARSGCTRRLELTGQALASPGQVTCRKPGRLQPELRRGAEQLRYLQRDRKRLGEYREALVQQYRFLESYLRGLSDQLPRSGGPGTAAFRVEAAARSRGRERANGDRCMAFPGPGCRYFLLLCDGMGTGLAAAREGDTAARLLRQMLGAGFPPRAALGSLNSLLVLRGSGGAVTVDLAEVRLDTGITVVYKWGAAPSWVLHRSGAEKIGTASPPPGIDLQSARESVEKLSLCRGDPLILLSDGVDGEDVLHRLSVTPDAPPGELAADILEKGCRDAQDDMTAAVIRLRPVNLATS